MDRGTPTPQRLGAAPPPIERGTAPGTPSRPETPSAPPRAAPGRPDEIHLEPHIILSEN